MERGRVNRRERGTVRGAFSQFHSTSCTVLKGQCRGGWGGCHCQQKGNAVVVGEAPSGWSVVLHVLSVS